ncbi:GntR family transcriptional regulator [Sinosporangium siamense]|uniref:UbiC transcription regulator-associated domain-containing protein n=1 Tax=Sinosporangium siamense TaxID=1367973 RepID=A0A919V7A3_9ACTN|nr:UTRA domain-containing protein [Sinosporangium siamense]GII91877.1 hypothetical protein Ssi02_21080 [Sinosporangium siamense]
MTAISKESADGAAPVLVWRDLPTAPAVRGSKSLFMTEAAGQGLSPGREMLYVGPEPAGERVAEALRVPSGAEVVARRKVMTVREVPVRVATSYFRADLFGGTRLAEQGFVTPTLQSAIAELGHVFGRAEEVLQARPASPYEVSVLRLEPGEWVVCITRASYSEDDVPVHVLETVCAASRHMFRVRQAAGHDTF